MLARVFRYWTIYNKDENFDPCVIVCVKLEVSNLLRK